MTRWALLLALLGAGCSPTEPRAPSPALITAPSPEPAPAADGESAPPEASRTSAPSGEPTRPLRVAAGMPVDGEVNVQALASAANAQIRSIAGCTELIRKTDANVGSINVELLVESDGSITAELQSPLAPDARRCLLDGISEWRITNAGVGRALILIALPDAT